MFFFFFSSRRRHTRCSRDWSSDVCSSDLILQEVGPPGNKAVEIYHDVLAPTILDWQAQIVRERRRAEERRRLRRRLIRIGLIGLVILAVAGYIAYTSWRAARPWATVADLRSGRVFQLKGAQDVIGR